MTDLVERFLNKAQEALDDARILRDAGRVAGPISRAYYAMFHATEALLASVGLEFSSHHAVVSAFGREFVKTGLLDQRFHGYLRLAFEERQTADYDEEVEMTDEQADRAIAAATEFIAMTHRYLAPPEPTSCPSRTD